MLKEGGNKMKHKIIFFAMFIVLISASTTLSVSTIDCNNVNNYEKLQLYIDSGIFLSKPKFMIFNGDDRSYHNITLFNIYFSKNKLLITRKIHIIDELKPQKAVIFEPNNIFVGFGGFTLQYWIKGDDIYGLPSSDLTRGYIFGTMIYIPWYQPSW